MARSLTFTEYLRNLIAIPVFIILLTLSSIFVIVFVLLSFGTLTNWLIRNVAPALGRPVLYLLGIDFEIRDLRKNISEPVVFLFNHSSTLDIPALLALALQRIRIVVKWELQYFPFFLILGRMTGQVFIKRSNKEHAVSTLQKTYERLRKNNLNLVIAPEGSRKHEGKIGPFKKGAFRMAIDLGYPIVPIYFDGNDELSLGGSLLSKSGKIIATIHEPIDTSDWNIETLEDHIAEVRGLYLGWAGVNSALELETKK